MCQENDQVVLELPDHIDRGKEVRSISADRCCVDVLKHLWRCRIDTRSHCCGHGKTEPSIILAGVTLTKNYIDFIEQTITAADKLKRKWLLLQWQLVQVNG